MNVQLIATIMVALGALLLIGGIVAYFALRQWKQRKTKVSKNGRSHVRSAQSVPQVPWNDGQAQAQELNDLRHQVKVANLKSRLRRGEVYRDIIWPLHGIVQGMRDAGHEPTDEEIDKLLERLLKEANHDAEAEQPNLFGSLADALEKHLSAKSSASASKTIDEEVVRPWER